MTAWNLGRRCLFLFLSVSLSAQGADKPLDLGGVREQHLMIPMRDGVKLSAYLYFPKGDGPWPVLYEQRYASLRSPGTRKFLRFDFSGCGGSCCPVSCS